MQVAADCVAESQGKAGIFLALAAGQLVTPFLGQIRSSVFGWCGRDLGCRLVSGLIAPSPSVLSSGCGPIAIAS